MQLYHQISKIVKETSTLRVAVAFHDYETKTSWSYQGDSFFHSASTIKVAVLVGIFALVEEKKIDLASKVHVRNRFHSSIGQKLFKLDPSRDGCPSLYSSVGKLLTVSDLAYHMIVTSSNLATNLLIDLVGVEALNEKLAQIGTTGIELKRGVEDELAYEQGLNNRVTANGLIQLFAFFQESSYISTELKQEMLNILFDQKFNQGIPIGIPTELRNQTRFAHKTGEISVVAHDSGLVYLPDRKPYAIAILTEREPGVSKSRKAIQRLSRLIYKNFVASGIHEMSEDHE